MSSFRTTSWLSLALLLTLGANPCANAEELPSPYRVALEYILFNYDGTPGSDVAQRNREVAQQTALEVHDRLLRGDLVFDQACRAYSNDPTTRRRGGYWGIFTRDDFTREYAGLSEALFKLKVDEISQVVETALGYHIFRRVPVREWSGAHILIQFKGCERAPSTLTRSQKEAAEVLQSLLKRMDAGEVFADLAKAHSEAPDAKDGGSLGIFGPHEILPPLEAAVRDLKIDATSKIVQSRLGLHLVRRTAVEHRRAAHILIRFRGAAFGEQAQRSREEAKASADTIVMQLRRRPQDFAELLAQHSEDGNKNRGGDLGLIRRGEVEPAFEKALFALKVGEISGVVETSFGFHVIRCLPTE